jgi:hypothetical protein
MGLVSKVITKSSLEETREADTMILRNEETSLVINNFFDASGPFNCSIFSVSEDKETSDHILQSIDSFGKLLPLSENIFMLLFPSSIDHTLLLHHLDKRFHLNIVEQFSADAPQKVLDCIQNYI